MLSTSPSDPVDDDRPEAAPRRWEQIAAALRADILAGRFAPGARLPNEATLATRFGVNRHTLRQAVQRLMHEGHLRVVQGSGTFVRELVLDYALGRRTRMSENLARAAERGRRELLGHARCAVPAWAASLGLAPRQQVELLHTRTSIRGRPIGIGQAAYPLPRFAGMAELFVETRSITSALSRLGVADYARAGSTVSCRLPTPTEADLLARPRGEPVLVVQYHSVDNDGMPVEAGRSVFAGDAVQLTVSPDS